MAKLRLREIHYACIPRGPDYLPDELRWIDWDKYPSNYLPTTFEADFLIGLRLCYSRLKQLWEGRMRVWSDEGHHRRDLIRSGLRCHGPITDLGAELSFTVPGRDHSMQKKAIFLRDTDNIIGQEHTIMGYRTLDPPKCCDCGFKECDGIEVGIRSLCPDAVVVKKWGVRVVLRDDDDERDYSYYNVVKTMLSYEDVK
ncbi:hypothetical protein LguiB_020634 [Lonicera macranthoides]